MIRFFSNAALAMLWMIAASTQPAMAESYPIDYGDLQPHQQLEVPQAPPEEPVIPEPESEIPILGTVRQIVVGETDSLLNQQGIMEPVQAGLKDNSWRYMSETEALNLLQSFQQTIEPEPLKQFIINSLLIKAKPPLEASNRWFAARLLTLNQLDDTAKAAQLLASVPASLHDSIPPLAAVSTYLSARAPEKACLWRDKPAQSISPEQWQRFDVYCEAVSGNFPKVELALKLANESDSPMPEWYIELVEHFQYPQTRLPQPNDEMGILDRMMLRAITPKDIDRFVKKPKLPPVRLKHAYPTIAMLFEQARLDELEPWLNLVDRKRPNDAKTYVAFELERLLKRQHSLVRSSAARQLPPFTAIDGTSEEDIALLARFFAIAKAFGYNVPDITAEWISGRFSAGKPIDTSALEAQLNRGNTIGFVLTLASTLQTTPAKQLDPAALELITLALNRLQQTPLAKSFAVHALVSQW